MFISDWHKLLGNFFWILSTGVEPVTFRTLVGCSTTELLETLTHGSSVVEHLTGVWKVISSSPVGRTQNFFTELLVSLTDISHIIVHSTKLLVSDWTRAVQLIPNCTLKEYLLGFYGNDDFRRSSEDFRRVQNSPKGIRRFPKMTWTLPKISEDDTNPSEDDPKISEDDRSSGSFNFENFQNITRTH